MPLDGESLQSLGSAWSAQQNAAATTEAPPPETIPAETPAPETVPAGQVAAGDAPAGEAPASETPEVKPEQPRAADGKFVKVQEIEHNGQKYVLPPDLPLTLKVKGETVTRTLEDLMRGGMREEAFNQGRQDDALRVRGAKAEAAEAKAEAAVYKAQLDAIKANPMLAQRLAEDPEFATHYEKGLAYDVGTAQRQAAGQVDAEVASQQGVQTALSWLQAAAQEFPDVDAEDIRVQYGNYLNSESAQTDPQAFTPQKVRAFFERAQQKVASRVSPLKAELDALRAEVAALKSAKAPNNAATAHALTRAAAPPVLGQGGNTGGLAPVGSSPIVGQDGKPMEIRDAGAAWLKQKLGR